MRKPRPPQGPLQRLSRAQRALLISWLREGKTYRQVVPLLWQKLEVRTSEGALSNFYQRNIGAILGKPEQAPYVDGIGVTVTCRRVGVMKLEIYPLPLAGDGEHGAEAPTTNAIETGVRAERVEIVASAGISPDQIRLIVRPLPSTT